MNRIVSAIKSGFEDKALSILKEIDYGISNKNYSKLIDLAFKFDTAKILEWLINSSYHRFDLNINLSYEFAIASYKGHLEIIKLLLQDQRVDPSINDNGAIRFAIMSERLEIAKLLLQDKRVDPSADINFAIRCASQYGHAEIVKLLLLDKRVNPCAENNYAIKYARKNRHLEVVKILEEAGCNLSS